jgi:hypothetical protein
MRAAAAVMIAAALWLVPVAGAAERFERIGGFAAKGTPAKYNRVGILKIGSPKAKNVLVLNPGTSASAAYFAPLARSVVTRAQGWQVWAVERRENLLEDHSVLDRAKTGAATPQELFDYYLGWIEDASVAPHFSLIQDADVAFAKRWGMNTQIQDLRRVVLRAQRQGGKVVVGGHSLGGTITSAYATWDFKGKPGARGLSGLVFIDGGSSPTPVTKAEAEQSLADLEAGSPWLSFGGIGAPFAGLFNSGGSTLVKIAPDQPSQAQDFAALPADLKPPLPATNAGQYGYALDVETSPAPLAAAQGNLGHLAESGDPRGWDDAGELTPLARFADTFSGWGLQGLDGTAWYHPLRLTIDGRAIAAGNDNAAQKVLGLHAIHGDDLPKRLRIYAFGASLGGTRVLDAARALADQSQIPASRLVLVDRHETYAHNDPNTASPGRNAFLQALIPFLGKVAGD